MIYFEKPLPVYDSYCVICDKLTLQTVPDNPDNRHMCYECYQIARGKTPTRIDQISANLTEMNKSEAEER